MPIRMEDGPDGHRSRFVCDFCGEVIEDAIGGIVAWYFDGKGLRGDTDRLYFAHERTCDWTLEATVGRATMSMSLLEFPMALANASTPAARGGTPIVAMTERHPRFGR